MGFLQIALPLLTGKETMFLWDSECERSLQTISLYSLIIASGCLNIHTNV